MARPKSNNKKEQINLTINREILKRARDLSNHDKKSLSQYTENLYDKDIKNCEIIKKGFINPKEALNEIKAKISKIETMIEKKEEDEKSSQ